MIVVSIIIKKNNHMKTTITLIIALFTAFALQAQQWNHVSALPQAEYSALEIIDGIMFTASGNQLYYTGNPADGWQQATISNQWLFVTCFAKYKGRLYAGTMGKGIFSAPMGQFQSNWNHDIGYLDVTSFLEKDHVLYVSTEGSGVYRKNSNSFTSFSNHIPNYSQNVSRIIDTPGQILITAGGNGTFYTYNFPQNRWDEDYYHNTYSPGMQIDDAIRVGNTVYVSNFGKILRSEDSGQNWASDKIGIHNGHNRYLYAGQEKLYALTTAFTGDANLTFLQHRDLNAPSQTLWSPSETLSFFTYELREFGGWLYAAGFDGFYTNNPTLGNFEPYKKAHQIVAYPNPSADRKFTLKSSEPITSVEIFNAAGQRIQNLANNDLECEIQVPAGGIYLARAITADSVQTLKIVSP